MRIRCRMCQTLTHFVHVLTGKNHIFMYSWIPETLFIHIPDPRSWIVIALKMILI
jgi:hypothetical protein